MNKKKMKLKKALITAALALLFSLSYKPLYSYGAPVNVEDGNRTVSLELYSKNEKSDQDNDSAVTLFVVAVVIAILTAVYMKVRANSINKKNKSSDTDQFLD